jgi:ribosomal protein L37AE/L43A
VLPSNYTLDVIIYGLLVLGVFGFMWIYYDRRDRDFYDTKRRKITFHCIRCDHLYTEKAGTEIAPCPRCGHQNTRLKF